MSASNAFILAGRLTPMSSRGPRFSVVIFAWSFIRLCIMRPSMRVIAFVIAFLMPTGVFAVIVGGGQMKMLFFIIIGTTAVVFAAQASAQVVNLNGRYRCIQVCSVGSIGKSGYVTQSEGTLNVWSQTGASSRAWINWFSPHRIWLENWNE